MTKFMRDSCVFFTKVDDLVEKPLLYRIISPICKGISANSQMKLCINSEKAVDSGSSLRWVESEATVVADAV